MDIALGSLASFAFSIFKNMTSKTIAHIHPLSDIENEPAYNNLKTEFGDKINFRWVSEANVRKLTRDGWEPVTEQNLNGRTIFMDKNEELLLMCKK